MRALTAHLKSKLLTFPGRDPQHPRFDTRDEAERARVGLYALHQRAAEAATIRAWATGQLQGQGQQRHVLVCGDLNDTPQAATTQVLLGRPGSQLGTGGFNQPDSGDGNRLWNLAPKMPAGDPVTGEGAANWSRINNGVKELIDQVLVSHLLVHALEGTESLPLEGIKRDQERHRRPRIPGRHAGALRPPARDRPVQPLGYSRRPPSPCRHYPPLTSRGRNSVFAVQSGSQASFTRMLLTQQFAASRRNAPVLLSLLPSAMTQVP